MKGLAVALGRAGGEIEQVPEELGVEAGQRAGAGALVLGLREASTRRRAVTDGAIRASEFFMLTGLIVKDLGGRANTHS